MRISARNRIKGTIREVRKGATTAHVLVDVGDSDIAGPLITSSITNESVDGLSPASPFGETTASVTYDMMVGADDLSPELAHSNSYR